MNKLLLTFSTFLLLLASSQTFALDKLNKKDHQRIWDEAKSMQQVLNLSDEKTEQIAQLKATLNHANNDLVRKYGKGTPEHQQGRAPYWKEYRQGMLKVVTQKQLNKYNQSQK